MSEVTGRAATVVASADPPAANAPAEPSPRPTGRPIVSTGSSRRRRWGRSASARSRILGGSLILLAVSLLITTSAVHLLLSRRADQRIDAQLSHEIEEFQALRAGPQRTSGTLTQLLQTATSRAVPESDIYLIGIVAGRVQYTSSSTTPASLGLRRSDLARLNRVSTTDRGTLDLADGAARYVAIRIGAARSAQAGLFVAAVSVRRDRAAVWRVTRLQLEVGAAALLLASLMGWLLAGRVLRPIRETTALANRITDADLSERLPVSGSGDEVSRMATTFNAMLDRLQDTFSRQRQFLADAGHELRTPITVIQGNLDTLSTTDPDDAETLVVVADELTRMTRLVDELSLLASSARPDFLRLAPIDLAQLKASLQSKVQAIGDRRWSVRASSSGIVVLDQQRITQAVLQLASNAVAHTREGSPIELTLDTTEGQLQVVVADHGPGIPREQRERIFERFVRIAGDRDRSTGTGLGLSIVAAIAEAHGGRVRASDTPGGGATMTLRIPIAPAGQLDGRGTARSPKPSRSMPDRRDGRLP